MDGGARSAEDELPNRNKDGMIEPSQVTHATIGESITKRGDTVTASWNVNGTKGKKYFTYSRAAANGVEGNPKKAVTRDGKKIKNRSCLTEAKKWIKIFCQAVLLHEELCLMERLSFGKMSEPGSLSKA